MAQALQLVDFCKNGLKKVAKGFAPGVPLTAVAPVGLTSLGCQPLLAHRSDAGQAILSQIRQDKGTVVRQLLTTPNDSGIVGVFPNTQECLPYGALIAGLPGALPLTGSAANPFPTTEPDRTLLWTVGGAGIAQVVNGTAQSLANDPTAFDLFTASSMVGFGGTNGGTLGGNTLVQLPPDNREYVGNVRLRANHHYVPTMQLPYSPLLEPLLYSFNASAGYSIIPGFFVSGAAVIGSNGSCDVEAYGTSVAPCLVVPNGDFIDPNASEPNGPSLHRLYNLYRLTPFTVPAFAGSVTGTWDVPKSNLRAFLCVYASSARIDSVTCHEGASAGTTAVTLPVPGSGPPSVFTPVFPGIAFDTVYQFSVLGNEAGYTFDVTHGASTVTTSTTSFRTVASSHVRCFEVFLDMHRTANPSLLCS